MNKLLHGGILAVFAFACLLMWGMLTLVSNGPMSIDAPAFTRLWADLRWIFWVLPIVAAGYCCFVFFRKDLPQGNWFGFFAAVMTALVLMLLLTLVAVWLPLVVRFTELAANR